MKTPRAAAGVTFLTIVVFAWACTQETKPKVPDVSRGHELIERMSATLAKANAVRISTSETRTRLHTGAGSTHLEVNREVAMRRPNGLHFKTSGGRDLEGWYDGKRLTLMSQHDRVFAVAPMPSTIDSMLDVLTERYGVPMPVGDLLYSSPARVLLSPTTTGGYVGLTDVDGVPAHHLAFKDQGVDWELWLAARGAPLPLRMKVMPHRGKRPTEVDVRFEHWDLTPDVAETTFVAHVPSTYEGIAMIQRASAVLPSASEQAPPRSFRGDSP